MPQQFHIRLNPGISSFIVILCCLILLNYSSGFAQDTTPASATDTTKVVKVIEPVPLANIGTETETTLIALGLLQLISLKAKKKMCHHLY